MTIFGGSILKNRTFNFENNLPVKQYNFLPQMFNYARQKIRLGAVWGQTMGTIAWSSLRISPGWGNCAYVARGIDAPAARIPW